MNAAMDRIIRILYAEGNPHDADLTRSYFAEKASDFAVEVVDTRQGCLDRLHQAEFDLLLLDHHLPEMDGLDVLRVLVHAGAKVPVVLVTDVSDEGLVVKALRLGAASYVHRLPNYLETLPDLLRDVVEENRRNQDQGLLSTTPTRILYVEHQPMDIELTLRHFAQVAPHFVVEVVRTCAEATARLLQTQAYDLALIDLRMPDQSGLDFVRETKSRRIRLPPFIMISGKGDEAAAIATLKLGAADYVTKREGYLEQLACTIDRAITLDRLRHLNEQLRTELTERKRIEARLRESEEWLKEAQALGRMGSWEFDIGTETIVWSEETYALYERDPQLGPPSLEEEAQYYTSEQAKALRECSARAIATGQVFSYDLVAILPSGKTAHFRAVMRPVKDAHGRVVRLAGVVQDMTEHRKLEDQLLQAQKMEAVGQLAGGVAHDFNNILSVIMGFSELLRMETKPDCPQMSYVDEILAASRKAAALTRSLLTFSRKQVADTKPVDINDILIGLGKVLPRVIREDIVLRLHLSEEALIVMADRGQIEQVVMNLAINARDAMSTGGEFCVHSDAVRMDEGFVRQHGFGEVGPYGLIALSDTGVGMDEKTRSRIFEPFFTTKEAGKGTGLGLAMAYGIIKQHNGYITCYSEPGRGTTFRIYLPLREGSAEEELPAAMAAPKGGTETVLVAEDDEGLRRLTRRSLEKGGYTVIEAVNGEEAVAAFIENRDRTQILIFDVIMPKKGGFEALAAIRKINPDVKAILVSGYAADTMQMKDVTKAGTAFMHKPFSPAALLDEVRHVLDGTAVPLSDR